MARKLKSLYSLMVMFGVDPRRTVNSMRGLRLFRRDLKAFKKQIPAQDADFQLGRFYPCLEDRFVESGMASGHYFHQDLLVARRVHDNQPAHHVDVGSRIDGFVAHVAAFRPIEVIDIRPLTSKVTNITFAQADLMQELKPELVDRCDSLSCLHALEHFGLGRYGDPVKYDGHLAGLENLRRILKRDGKFYFSVPIGPQRVEFNAHRVFSLRFLRDYFADKYRLDRFSYVDDAGDLHEDVKLDESDVARSFGCSFGCGIFEMTKL